MTFAPPLRSPRGLLKSRTIPDILPHPEVQQTKAQNLVAVDGFNP
jgi:hypothetical protein